MSRAHAPAAMLLLVLAPFATLAAVGQQTAAPAGIPLQAAPESLPDGPLYTLHVYTNLMQIPTLVVQPRVTSTLLGNEVAYTPVKGLSLQRFKISLDSGRPFHATQMHVEGDDPLSLSIVFDRSSQPARDLARLATALQNMVTQQLLPHDRVSVYALNCQLVRSLRDAPPPLAASGDNLLRAITSEAAEQQQDGPPLRQAHTCSRTLRLWDSVGIAAHAMAELPGRRVLLVLSQGEDRRSVMQWKVLRRYAASHSITIFGVETPQLAVGWHSSRSDTEDAFRALCELTGGVLMNSDDADLQPTLTNFVAMLRNRYLLEFPRPNDGQSGEHAIGVKLNADALVLPAGITVPLADPKLATDPTVLPAAPSPATFGTRRQGPTHP